MVDEGDAPHMVPNPLRVAAAEEEDGGRGAGDGNGDASAVTPAIRALLAEMTVVETLRAATARWLKRKSLSNEYVLRMGDVPGIPVRELLLQVFSHERSRTIMAFMRYAVFVILFVSVILQINDTQLINNSNAALEDLLLNQEFPWEKNYFRKTFHDIGQYEEFMSWMTGLLVPTLFPTAWYNGKNLNTALGNNSYLLAGQYYQLSSDVRLWQARVSNRSCSPLQRRANDARSSNSRDWTVPFNRPNGACFGAWSEEDADRAPFGPSGKYKWQAEVSQGGVPAIGLWGWGQDGATAGMPDYGVGGYPVYLNRSGGQDAAMRVVKELVDDTWVDAQTRLVAVDILLYNWDTNLQSLVRLQVEFPNHGHLLTKTEFMTFRSGKAIYASQADAARAVGEVIIILGCLRYLFAALARILRRRRCDEGAVWFEIITQVRAPHRCPAQMPRVAHVSPHAPCTAALVTSWPACSRSLACCSLMVHIT